MANLIDKDKVIAEILPLESADARYYCKNGNDLRLGGGLAIDKDFDIPAWSITSLISVLPRLGKVEYNIVINSDEIYVAFDDYDKNIHEDFDGDTPIDALCNMILWLKENVIYAVHEI